MKIEKKIYVSGPRMGSNNSNDAPKIKLKKRKKIKNGNKKR